MISLNVLQYVGSSHNKAKEWQKNLSDFDYQQIFNIMIALEKMIMFLTIAY